MRESESASALDTTLQLGLTDRLERREIRRDHVAHILGHPTPALLEAERVARIIHCDDRDIWRRAIASGPVHVQSIRRRGAVSIARRSRRDQGGHVILVIPSDAFLCARHQRIGAERAPAVGVDSVDPRRLEQRVHDAQPRCACGPRQVLPEQLLALRERDRE